MGQAPIVSVHITPTGVHIMPTWEIIRLRALSPLAPLTFAAAGVIIEHMFYYKVEQDDEQHTVSPRATSAGPG
jgi:hypothetical protein